MLVLHSLADCHSEKMLTLTDCPMKRLVQVDTHFWSSTAHLPFSYLAARFIPLEMQTPVDRGKCLCPVFGPAGHLWTEGLQDTRCG